MKIIVKNKNSRVISEPRQSTVAHGFTFLGLRLLTFKMRVSDIILDNLITFIK